MLQFCHEPAQVLSPVEAGIVGQQGGCGLAGLEDGRLVAVGPWFAASTGLCS